METPGYKKRLLLLLFVLSLLMTTNSFGQVKNKDWGSVEREYLVNTLVKIANPVLTNLSKNELVKNMPVEQLSNRKPWTYLEAFGRLLSGMAPWLELGPGNSCEGKLRAKYILLARECLHNATNPNSPDFMDFNKGDQPLVDASYLALALLRAPNQLWKPLSQETKTNIINALKSSRVIEPHNNNWLCFTATIEAAILKFTGQCRMASINNCIDSFLKWYVGDGVYGDGANFHWDYYNSYVIQPMLLKVLKTVIEANVTNKEYYEDIYKLTLKRAQRYAYIQQSLISPVGTYPPLGRSLAYRFGAFQLLSQIVNIQKLPGSLNPDAVRAALYTVIKRQVSAPGTFNKQGWLQIGMVGHQRAIAEGYISTGSLYLCSEAFLFLGLPPESNFWQGPDAPWISKKIWDGENISIHHSID